VAFVCDENAITRSRLPLMERSARCSNNGVSTRRPHHSPAPNRRSAAPQERGERHPSRDRASDLSDEPGKRRSEWLSSPRPARPAINARVSCFQVGDDGRFNGFEPFMCANDEEAIKKAGILSQRHGVELWSGPRLEGRSPNNQPEPSPMRLSKAAWFRNLHSRPKCD
jgi:hypothetical protein